VFLFALETRLSEARLLIADQLFSNSGNKRKLY
jgi:hypothetical protein